MYIHRFKTFVHGLIGSHLSFLKLILMLITNIHSKRNDKFEINLLIYIYLV